MLLPGAIFAAFTLVVGDLTFKTAFALANPFILRAQFPSLHAGVLVLLRVVSHVLPKRHVAFEFLRLAALVVLRLDIANGLYAFKVCVVLFAFVARVQGGIPVCPAKVFVHVVHEGDQRQLVAAFTAEQDAGDVFPFHPQLHIVARLELRVAHMVFLHVHEGGIRICL